MDRVVRRLVGEAHAWSAAPAARRFEAAARDPAPAQRAILLRILRANRGTAYARDHRLGDSVRAFRERAPIVGYNDVAPYVDRAAQGEPGVLTAEPVLLFERSGGSTRGPKLLPVTRAFLRELSGATSPWLADLLRAVPDLRGGASYWAISPVAQASARTPGGVPVGAEDDAAYFGPLAAWAIRRRLAVPPGVARIADVGRWREETARRLIAERDLRLVSAWSPTFLSRLMDEVHRQAGGEREGLGERLWPRLRLVSCWTDASSAAFVPELRRDFPTVPLQGKGLLATEGVVSFPLRGRAAPVAAVASHFLEFLDADRPEGAPLLAHELVPGRRYSPLLTTGAGLVRYHLPDAVTCVGFHARAPLLRFDGRLDHVADLCGEKVSEGQAADALRRALEKAALAPRFAMLAPSLDGPRYRFFVESDAPASVLRAVADLVDAALAEAHPYRHARELGQLRAPVAVRVRDGWAAYERRVVARGRRLGSAKPAALDPTPDWDDAFEVAP